MKFIVLVPVCVHARLSEPPAQERVTHSQPYPYA